MTATAAAYFQFLETPYKDSEGNQKLPAKGKYVEHLRDVHAAHRPRFDLSACLAGTEPGFAGRVWFWSDLHFSHENIIKYCDRPFGSAEEMNKVLIANALERVTADDILVIGGDITMSGVSVANALLRAIPAYKINVLGNHDIVRAGRLNLDVDEVAACLEFEFAGQSYLATHYPVAEAVLRPGQLNLHGHIHNGPLPPALGRGDRHVCMCVERTGYAPRLMAELLARTSGWR